VQSSEWECGRIDRAVVGKMAAKVIAYRCEMGSRKGNEIFQDRAMSEAVRKKVEEHEASE
jgi:hypothetical protein